MVKVLAALLLISNGIRAVPTMGPIHVEYDKWEKPVNAEKSNANDFNAN